MEYKGKTILLEDFSDMRPGQVFFDNLRKAQYLIRSRPLESVLALFDATGSTFNVEVLSALKDFVKGNTPHIKCSAVVGIKGLMQVGLAAVGKVAGRPFRLFDTREKALEFLAGLE
jgi:hypothetical protein